MEWQNIIDGNCPRCGHRMEPIQDHTIVYECTNREEKCEFFVTQKKMLRILTDKDHPMRMHLTVEQSDKLEALGL